MSRAIELTLKPADDAYPGGECDTYTYKPDEPMYARMAESVYLDINVGRSHCGVCMTPDEARVLANQLMQVADTAEEHRAAREADDELQVSFDGICEELRNSDDRGTGVYYSHPDVHYVPADQVEAKAQELNAAGVKRFMVLVAPTAEVAG